MEENIKINKYSLYNNLAKIIHKDEDLIAERIILGSPILIHRTLVFPVKNIFCKDGFINLKKLCDQWNLEIYYVSYNRSFYLCYKQKVINTMESINRCKDIVKSILLSYVPFDPIFRKLQLTLLAFYKDRCYYINSKEYRKEKDKYIKTKDAWDLDIYLENNIMDVEFTTPYEDLFCEKCRTNLKDNICLVLLDRFYQSSFYCEVCGESLRKKLYSQRYFPKANRSFNNNIEDINGNKIDINELLGNIK